MRKSTYEERGWRVGRRDYSMRHLSPIVRLDRPLSKILLFKTVQTHLTRERSDTET